jgi:Tfp pilus assembly protein PilF
LPRNLARPLAFARLTRPQRSSATPMTRPYDLRRIVALGLVAATASCAPESKGPAKASPERQAEAEYDLARDAFYKQHLREALDHSQRSNALDDQNSKSLYFTAVIYLAFCSAEGMQGPDCLLRNAERLTRKAIEVESDFRDAKNMLGLILIHEKRYDDAIKVLEPLTKDPAYVANYLAWGNLGWAQVESGKIDDGINSLRNSITEPRFCTGDYHLGVAYEKKGDLDAAEKSLTDAVQVPMDECQGMQDAWYERGNVRSKLGNAAGAEGDYARCREISTKTDTGKLCAKLAGRAPPTPVSPIKKPEAPARDQGGEPKPAEQQASDAGHAGATQ